MSNSAEDSESTEAGIVAGLVEGNTTRDEMSRNDKGAQYVP